MADLTIVAADVAPVEVRQQKTEPAVAAVLAGQLCRITTAGKWTPANATDAANAGVIRGLSIQDSGTDLHRAVTCVQKGIVDVGDALDALAIGDLVYLSDTVLGVLGTTAGTVSLVVGRVVGNWGATVVQKLLEVDL